MTAFLTSYQAWLKYYETEAKNLPLHIQNDPHNFRSAMLEISRVALERRARQLRNSDDYLERKILTAAAGLIPFVKIPVADAAAESFADQALLAFGLDNVQGLTNLASQLKASTSGRSDVPKEILKAVTSLCIKEILGDMASNVATEAVHLKPIIGQLISAGAGYRTVRKRMIGVIGKARAIAGPIHEDILIPVAVYNQWSKITPSASELSRVGPAIVPSSSTTTTTQRRVSMSSIIAKGILVLLVIPLEAIISFTAFIASLAFRDLFIETDTQKIWMLLAMVCLAGYASKRSKAFRVMLLNNLLGLATLWSLEFSKEDEGVSFIIATVAGILFLRL